MTHYGPNFENSIQTVRYLVGDNDPEQPKLSDAEIAYELGVAGGVARLAAAAAAFALEARYADMPDVQDGELRISGAGMAERYHALGVRLADPSTVGLPSQAVPFAGGISRADKETRDRSEDRVPPFFDRPYGRPPLDVARDRDLEE